MTNVTMRPTDDTYVYINRADPGSPLMGTYIPSHEVIREGHDVSWGGVFKGDFGPLIILRLFRC